MATNKQAEAFDILYQASQQRSHSSNPNIDVENPAELLRKRMKVGFPSAKTYLHELARQGAISLVYGYGYESRSVVGVNIRQEQFDEMDHEQDEVGRLVEMLWSHKVPSKINQGRYFVSGNRFERIRREADLTQPKFYRVLHLLERSGLVVLEYKAGVRRIQCATFGADLEMGL